MGTSSLSEVTTDKMGDAQIEDVTSQSPILRQNELALRQTALEKNLTFWQTARMFWRSTLWICYGQLVVFGYGIDGIIAAYTLAIPQFRYLPLPIIVMPC